MVIVNVFLCGGTGRRDALVMMASSSNLKSANLTSEGWRLGTYVLHKVPKVTSLKGELGVSAFFFFPLFIQPLFEFLPKMKRDVFWA